MDGEVLGTLTERPFDLWWVLQPGEHTVDAEVRLADGSTVTTDAIPFRVGAWVPPDERPASGPAE